MALIRNAKPSTSQDAPGSGDRRRFPALLAAYTLTIFLSAFLLFQVQPLIAKFILPWFGGTPGVWTACMLFFQIGLFAGYAYAHFSTSHLRPRTQALVHIVLLGLACLALPIIPSIAFKPTGNQEPMLRIVALLGVTVGMPFFVLSSTGPLLQSWFSRTHSGRSPYRLYALSNIGSLLALVSYPFVFDLAFRTRVQAQLWSWAFGLFATLCALCAWGMMQNASYADAEMAPPAASSGAAPSRGRRLLWFSLAFVPSVLLLATTNQVCQEVISVPFLWVLPLTLYLLSFILCFDSDRWYSRRIFMPAAAAGLLGVYLLLWEGVVATLTMQIGGYFLALFLAAMVCHGELVKLKPATRHLTSFYLLISAGGAAGGIFVAVIAPLWFNRYFELQIGIFACAALMLVVLLRDAKSTRFLARPWRSVIVPVAVLGPVALALIAQTRSRPDVVAVTRNFYGVLRVMRDAALRQLPDGNIEVRPTLELLNGPTNHGREFQEPLLRQVPTSYYGHETGVGRLLLQWADKKPRRIGLVGLGTGTLAAYAHAGDSLRIYEINPAVVQFARQYFHFLGDCRGKVEVVLGDARLMLERESPQNFDVLVLDAFAGDAIPVHLLTDEAFAIYLRHLAPDGVIAAHVSSRHFDLVPVIGGLAASHRLTSVDVESGRNGQGGIELSRWVLLARNRQPLAFFGARARGAERMTGNILWTDDHAALFQITRW